MIFLFLAKVPFLFHKTNDVHKKNNWLMDFHTVQTGFHSPQMEFHNPQMGGVVTSCRRNKWAVPECNPLWPDFRGKVPR